MIKKKKKIIAVIISLIALSVFLFLFIILPIGLLGAEPAYLFNIYNNDDTNHTVTVEIFNSGNKSIYYKSFNVQPNNSIKIDRGFDWCPKRMFYWFYWDEGSYTFNVTLDNTYNESYHTDLYPVKSIWIKVYSHKGPLYIGAVTI